MIDGQIVLEEPELENKPNLAHFVQATGEIVQEFCQYLNEETDRLTRVKGRQLGRDYEFGTALAQLDPEMHARLHRLKLAADTFLAALGGHY